ncbi:unnamed protein product [Effrenium voratum]|uniref:Sulfoacetaldehyde acetyltransferase n=1 Tax=Effrenium voratum TaxID=2562239 RepID=A0AA36HKX9_9DINO|nr:unnamed protein product [Effrenium voratum]
MRAAPILSMTSQDVARLLLSRRPAGLRSFSAASKLMHGQRKAPMRMTTEEAFVKTLQMHGIKNAFGIIGSAMMPISDLFPKAGIKFWDCAHECNAGMMADGYTRTTGKMSMMIAQNGPGITNFLTPVKTAYWNHTPLLLVTPQAANKTIGQGGFQEVEQMNMFKDCVCYQEEVRDHTRIVEVLNRVIEKALLCSAPAQINIPRDYWTQVVELPLPTGVKLERTGGGKESTRRAAELLSEAKFPVILNGAGVILSGGTEQSVKLAERLGAPVCCNYQHNDAFPGDHPLGAEQLRSAGAGSWERGRSARPCGEEEGQGRLGSLTGEPGPRAGRRGHHLEPSRAPGSAGFYVSAPGLARDHAGHAQGGHHVFGHRQQLRHCNAYPSFASPRKYLAPGLFGPCGYGFPAILGAKVGNPDVPVVGFAGDGAFGISVNEITACGRGDWPPVTMVVFRNFQWGAEKRNTTLWYDDNFVGTELNKGVEYAEMAKACGLKGVKVQSVEQLERALSSAIEGQMKRGETTLVEVLLNQELGEPFRRDAMKAPVQVAPINASDMAE